MYIKKLVYENVGPIKNIQIDMPLNEHRTPKPVILVGEKRTKAIYDGLEQKKFDKYEKIIDYFNYLL